MIPTTAPGRNRYGEGVGGVLARLRRANLCAGTRRRWADRAHFTRFLILCVLLAIPGALFAQDSLTAEDSLPDSVFSVDSVYIRGNDHTKDFVILREMSLHPGVPITRELLAYDRSRIYSLGLFNQVEIRVAPTVAGKASLLVDLHERWYIFPYPIFGIKDRDWSKLFYGAGIVHFNFRGRNEKLFTSIVLGYDPSVSVGYRNPFLTEEGLYSIDARVAWNRVQNRSVLAQGTGANFDERHIGTSVTLGRRFGIQHSISMGLAYEQVEIPDPVPGRTLDPSGIDRYPIFSAGYAFDTRDLSEFPSSGTFFRVAVTKYGFPGAVVDFVRYSGDVRKYVPLPFLGLTWTGRIFTDLAAAGPTPSYNRDYFGYAERIRGHFKEVVEGESQAGVSTELHYTLFPVHYFTVDFLPTEFGLWRFGIVAAAFADAGSAWFRGTPAALDRFEKGYGGGIDFLLPYSGVLRLEYAFNEVRRGEFILEAGAAF